MTEKLGFTLLIVLLISGCAVMADPESQTEETRAPSGNVAEKQADMVKSAMPAEVDREQSRQPEPSANKIPTLANRIPSKGDIRLLQARVKAVGFDPGPIDGVMGAKTEKALQQFQLACTTLSDLLDTPETDGVWKTADAQTSNLSVTTNQTPNKDEIRLIQARMKAVGFDPGPIDGVMGAKTRLQLVAAQSGCAMLKTFPAISDQELHMLEKQVSTTPSPKKPPQPASPSTTPAAAVNKKSDPQNISRKPWLVPMRSN